MREEQRVKTFHISTFGCQMNLADSSTLASTLIARGYTRVKSQSEADLLIFNTCSVREKAEERVFGRLGEMHKLKACRPGVRVAVVGCMAQRLGEEIQKQAPQVDYVLGTDRVFELPDVIEGREGTSPVMTAFGHESMDMIVPSRENAYSGFVTISRGCNNYCSYCIVPYVRGQERAHAADQIVESVRRMCEEGAVEITLLGQNVNSYRHGSTDFPNLLRRVAEESPVPRLRFMTSHPKDLSRKLVDLMAAEARLMPHIHLPMQSGSNRILQKMGRQYSIEHYLKIVEYIRAALPQVSLTTDLIVGFPSETEEEYEQTLAAVRAVRFDAAFMFRYSVRPGTAAANESDDVSEKDKIRRLNGLIALQQKIGYEQSQRELGETRFSVVEGPSRRSRELMRARTEGNKTVLFRSNGHTQVGTIVPLRITSADAFTLHGEQVEPN
jgi:tRNA-2-methylthio-N6-dimethylallyladenosine synthase